MENGISESEIAPKNDEAAEVKVIDNAENEDKASGSSSFEDEADDEVEPAQKPKSQPKKSQKSSIKKKTSDSWAGKGRKRPSSSTGSLYLLI